MICMDEGVEVVEEGTKVAIEVGDNFKEIIARRQSRNRCPQEYKMLLPLPATKVSAFAKTPIKTYRRIKFLVGKFKV